MIVVPGARFPAWRSHASGQVLHASKMQAWTEATEAWTGATKTRACASVHVLLIAALLLEIGHERDGLIGRACTVLRHDVDQRDFDVLRHPLGVAADIDMRAVGKPHPQIAADFAHAVLHVEFF